MPARRLPQNPRRPARVLCDCGLVHIWGTWEVCWFARMSRPCASKSGRGEGITTSHARLPLCTAWGKPWLANRLQGGPSAHGCCVLACCRACAGWMFEDPKDDVEGRRFASLVFAQVSETCSASRPMTVYQVCGLRAGMSWVKMLGPSHSWEGDKLCRCGGHLKSMPRLEADCLS